MQGQFIAKYIIHDNKIGKIPNKTYKMPNNTHTIK
jgi:hypothetical protein